MEIHEVLDLLAQTPRSEWADLDLSKYADADNGVAEQEADGLAVFFAECSAFLCALSNGANGEGAIKEAMEARKRFRKALGYAAP